MNLVRQETDFIRIYDVIYGVLDTNVQTTVPTKPVEINNMARFHLHCNGESVSTAASTERPTFMVGINRKLLRTHERRVWLILGIWKSLLHLMTINWS